MVPRTQPNRIGPDFFKELNQEWEVSSAGGSVAGDGTASGAAPNIAHVGAAETRGLSTTGARQATASGDNS